MALKLNARSIRDLCSGKVDPQVLFVLETLSEYQHVLYAQVMDVAKLVDQMSDILTNFTTVAENMKGAITAMQHDEGNPDYGDVTDAPTKD